MVAEFACITVRRDIYQQYTNQNNHQANKLTAIQLFARQCPTQYNCNNRVYVGVSTDKRWCYMAQQPYVGKVRYQGTKGNEEGNSKSCLHGNFCKIKAIIFACYKRYQGAK
jgi:hypothetical protein